LSPASAWQTLNRVNEIALKAGDSVQLRGGDRFQGGLYFDADDVGTQAAPVVVTSYGNGWATLLPGTGFGIYAYNTAGMRISKINVFGSGWESSENAGVFFFTDRPGTKLNFISIERLHVAGFRNGIEVGATGRLSGFRNVTIRDVVSRANRENGITVWGYDAPGYTGYAHENVSILRAQAYQNSGIEKTGSGIVISNVNGGRIERSVAHHNGIRLKSVPASGGPIGIWAWRANKIIIQHNESYNNRSTSGGADGGGFDLDGGVTNSIMQYNYSHGNDGAGYLLAQYKDALPFRNNVVRYNISENDSRKNYYGGITVWSYAPDGIRDTQIYNNTVYMQPSTLTDNCGVAVVSKTVNVSIRNNLIVTRGGTALMNVVSGQTRMKVQGNAYWSSGRPFRIYWAGNEFRSLGAFRATRQERIGNAPAGHNVDPKLVSPGLGVVLNDGRRLETLVGYRLRRSSPLIGKGTDLATWFGINMGPRDYFGTPVPSWGRNYEIGADEVAD
jgi:hypothetical protein